MGPNLFNLESIHSNGLRETNFFYHSRSSSHWSISWEILDGTHFYKLHPIIIIIVGVVEIFLSYNRVGSLCPFSQPVDLSSIRPRIRTMAQRSWGRSKSLQIPIFVRIPRSLQVSNPKYLYLISFQYLCSISRIIFFFFFWCFY